MLKQNTKQGSKEANVQRRKSLWPLRLSAPLLLPYFPLSTFYFLLSTFYFLPNISLAQPASTLFDIPWDDRTVFKQGLTAEAQEVLEQLPAAPIYHLEWLISDDLLHLEGTAEVLVTNSSDIDWNDLVFRLYPNALGSIMRVTHVGVNGITTNFDLEAEDTVLRIPLVIPLLPQQKIVVVIAYSLDISKEIQAYGRLARYENALSLPHAYPNLATLENGQWEIDIPPPLGDPLVANTSFFLVRVTAPKDYQLVTTGQEFHHSEQEMKQSIVYAAGLVRDFYLAAVKGYRLAETTLNDIRIRSLVPQQYFLSQQNTLRTVKQSLEFFSSYYPYPFREFDVVAIPVQAGGVEYPGIINITNSLYANPFGRLNTVITHEIGHQWAYSLVGSDQIDNPWLDEALTQYLTLRYQETYESRLSDNYLNFWRNLWNTSSFPNEYIGLNVEAYDENTYGEIVYGKGLFFFEELANTIGKETLDEALKIYFQTYAWRFTEPHEFKDILENTCTCNLDTHFHTWVRPELE
jgi:aminopeptidase N